jgi:uncharacterized protein DUF6627
MKISRLILSLILSMTMFAQASWGQMASTEVILGQSATISSKDKVVQFMAREDVTKKFEEMGVKPEMIEQRLASMTDKEASQIAYHIDTLPAGGDAGSSLVGAVVFVFLVLLITDILGLTNVFNFTKPVTN